MHAPPDISGDDCKQKLYPQAARKKMNLHGTRLQERRVFAQKFEAYATRSNVYLAWFLTFSICTCICTLISPGKAIHNVTFGTTSLPVL